MAQEYYQSAYTGAQFDSAIGRIVSGEFDELARGAVEASGRAVESAEISKTAEANAVSASEASQNVYVNVQKAIDTIPSGSTIVINDLTTGGTTAALSAEQGKVLSRLPNQNVLDNWYFGDPVNQKGSNEYGGSTAYTIDRWKTSNANTRVTVGNGVTIEALTSSATPYLLHPFSVEGLRGKRVALSVMLGDGTVKHATATIPTEDPSSNGMVYARITNTAEIIYLSGKWYIRLSAVVGGSATFLAVKLELGSIQTIAHKDSNGVWVMSDLPPDKGLETLKCQRYYQLFSSADKVPAKLVDYRPTMRANPATGTIVINGKTYYYADANL